MLAAEPVGKGGVFMAAVKMAVGNMIGAEITGITEKQMLASGYGSMILEIPAGEDAAALFGDIPYMVIGKTAGEGEKAKISIATEDGKGFEKSLGEIVKEWEEPLEGVFPTRTAEAKDKIEETVPAVNYAERNTAKPKVKVERPQVVIPVFPGTNCEVDSARAFERAGAIADIHIINTLSEESLNASIRELAEKIKKANIIFIPGGFSGGDEPDGSAKFITAVFRNPLVSEAVTDLLDNRDGLIIGICNGFQALIKLGLVPYGKITEPDENSPTLTYNRIGRHASCLVRTRVGSVKSPWLSESEVGDIYTIPVSHGEGNFICDEKLLNQLIENGQVVTQYVDFDGS